MKEIKAYIRIRMAHDVVDALERAGYCCLTVIDVSALGTLADPDASRYSVEFVKKYSKVAKIELICRDDDVDRVVEIIEKFGCTHQPGDGIIFVAPIECATKIRTGEKGESILQA